MFDPQKLLEQFLGGSKAPDGSQKPGGLQPDFVKGLAAGGVAGGLAGILLGGKGAKKLAKGALKIGGTAALAGLAYKVYSDWQASKTAAPATPEAPQPMKDITPAPVLLPDAGIPADAASLAIIKAMIAAAKADGHIDAAEQQKIFSRLDEANLGQAEKAFVMDELRKPLDIESVVAGAMTPELAVEIYTASVLAIDPDHPAEQAYLAMLAARLNLDPGLKKAIETETAKAMA